VIVRDLDDRDVMEMALIENVQRADLNPVEEAAGYNELIQRYQYTQEQLADVIGKSRSHLTNTLRLLKLPDDVRAMVLDGRLTAGQVRPLVGREDAVNWALRIAAGGMSVRQVEEAMQNLDRARENGSEATGPSKREKDADTKAFEKEFGEALGLKVEIKRGSGESGLLVIKFGNYDQLDYIRGRVLGGGAG
jgi:ParB family transcriptional regulator, chromosome partitioning protein